MAGSRVRLPASPFLLKMLIIFDWDGTLVKTDVANKAAIKRLNNLGKDVTKEYIKKAQETHAHYNLTKEAISNYTGIKDQRVLTIIMTNLFQLHYLAVVNEMKEKIFYKDIIPILKKLKQKYKLKYAIASTIRQDIIEPTLELVDVKDLFDYVYGNTPDLINTKQDNVNKLKNKNPILIVGDRKEDIDAGKHIGIKTAFASWGTEGSAKADFILNSPKDLKNTIQKLIKNE